MRLDVNFEESRQTFDANFGEIQTAGDGGFERGYEAGYVKGNADGYTKGHTDGLATRTYETWTITLVDGTIVEKEVALL